MKKARVAKKAAREENEGPDGGAQMENDTKEYNNPDN
jgi:hypothetical protein